MKDEDAGAGGHQEDPGGAGAGPGRAGQVRTLAIFHLWCHNFASSIEVSRVKPVRYVRNTVIIQSTLGLQNKSF